MNAALEGCLDHIESVCIQVPFNIKPSTRSIPLIELSVNKTENQREPFRELFLGLNTRM